MSKNELKIKVIGIILGLTLLPLFASDPDLDYAYAELTSEEIVPIGTDLVAAVYFTEPPDHYAANISNGDTFTQSTVGEHDEDVGTTVSFVYDGDVPGEEGFYDDAYTSGVIVEIASLSAGSIADGGTLYVPKGSDSITITATPNPAGYCPDDLPTWVGATGEAGATTATFTTETTSSSATGTKIEATCGTSKKSLNIVVADVKLNSIDASNPNKTKANYTLSPSGISLNGNFTAFDSKETKNNLSGSFKLKFKQAKYGGNIKLTMTGDKLSGSLTSNESASGKNKTSHVTGSINTYFPVEGVGWRIYKYSTLETLSINLKYSVPSSGKTLYVGGADAGLWCKLNPAEPISFGISHKYSFEKKATFMKPGSTLDPDESRRSRTYNDWIDKKSLSSVMKCTGIKNTNENVLGQPILGGTHNHTIVK